MWLLVVANFWIFSRYTVDDSFITWRYGYNLVEHGIWNYNPTLFDPTQAYTNPIYALLSIVPAFFGINVVLFFKLLSLLLGVTFIYLVVRKRPDTEIWLGLFFAVPATMIHLFAGLETFVFVTLMFAVMVFVMERRVNLALLVTALLFVTRPESWLLLGLVPLFLALESGRINWKIGFKTFGVLAGVLGTYFLITYSLFGQILPNTFFVKSGKDLILWRLWPLLWVLAILIPIAVLGYWRIVSFALCFALPVIWDYCTSTLAMDYASRYAYHLYAPFALLVIYIYGERPNRLKLRRRLSFIPLTRVFTAVGVLVISVGFSYAAFASDLVGYESYYPRLLAAHGAVGNYAKTLTDSGSIKAMAMSDAGIGPYRADISNLDALRLGTHLGATKGVDAKLISAYGVNFGVLSETSSSSWPIKNYLSIQGFRPICLVYQEPTYRLELWLKSAEPKAIEVCDNSKKANDVSNEEYFQKDVWVAPWTYWR